MSDHLQPTHHPMPSAGPPADNDAPLELERDDDRDDAASPIPARESNRNSHGPSRNLTPKRVETAAEPVTTAATSVFAIPSRMGASAGHMSDILHWALDSMHEPAMAAADWLARDIDPDQPTAVALLSDPKISLTSIKQAKSVFKTMRIVGEKSADRRVGARMYAASIAAALVRHRTLISRQSGEALARGFQGLLDDHRMPSALRDLAGMALCVLREERYHIDAREEREPTASKVVAKPNPALQRNSRRARSSARSPKR